MTGRAILSRRCPVSSGNHRRLVQAVCGALKVRSSGGKESGSAVGASRGRGSVLLGHSPWMKNMPEVAISFEPLVHMLAGIVPAKLLLTAIELRVFSHLTEAISADSLAWRMRTHPKNTRVLLDAMAANDLIYKRDGQYVNTPLAEMFLVEPQDTYLGDILLDDAEWMQLGLDNMSALVKSGPRPGGHPSHSISWAKEAEIRANGQRAGVAQRAAALIRQLPEFPSMKKTLDLGAGAGLIGLAIVAAHPTMTGVLFDRADVVEVAKRFIREYELESRVLTMSGDYSTDPIGDGYDLVWTSYTLNFHRDNLDPIFRKIHAALNSGGVFVSFAEGLTDERTRPAALVNAMLSNNLADHDVMFEQGEIAQAMLRSGFRSVHTRQAEGPHFHGPAIVDIARK